jgi:DNA-binding MarR family transcriptional regulator
MTEYNTEQSPKEFKPVVIVRNETLDSTSPAVTKTSYDMRVLQSIRRIIRAVDLHSRRLSVLHNITGPQLACLLAISEYGTLTESSLAREVHLSPSTIVGILDRLEQKEMVLRKRSSRDRRVVNIEITAKGMELVNSVPSPLQETLARALQGLPEIEQVSIALSLEKIVALMEAQGIDAAPAPGTGALVNEVNDKKNRS